VPKTIHIDAQQQDAQTLAMLKALANDTRMDMLRYLGDRVVAVNRIAADLGLPQSTATLHIGILERAGLIHTELRPAVRGLQKVCARTYDELVIGLPHGARDHRMQVEQSMPVGGFSDCRVDPTCGLAGEGGLIGFLDDPSSFFEPGRLAAQLVWFRSGFLEYRFPNRVPAQARITALQLSAEVCSEAPLHAAAWPSDISVAVNDVPLGTWTSPGDFGGERGRFTPTWWDEKDSQFGVLKRWRVGLDATTIDGMPLSKVTVPDLSIRPGDAIRVRVAVEPDAVHVGGINIFGAGFGNYPQDLVLSVQYEPNAGST
jgi:predicted transcriptional regulator